MANGRIEFSKIELTLGNHRTDLGDIDGLVASISHDGLLQPLVVLHKEYGGEGFKMPDGSRVRTRYLLISGHRRYEAIRRIKDADKKAFPDVPVTLFKGNEDDAKFAQIAENVQRKDLNPVELANGVRDMIQRGHKLREIATRIGISPGWASVLMKVRESCCNRVLTAITDGKVTVAAASEWTDMDEDAQGKALDKYTETRETKGRNAAKKEAKKSADHAILPGKKAVMALIDTVTGFDGDYWRGVVDALAFTTGASTAVTTAAEKETARRDAAKPRKEK